MENMTPRKLTIISKRPQYNGSVMPERKRVAAYCRVSTEKWQQQESYEVQVFHYTKLIQENPKYAFAGIYADDGISGTSLKKRDEFNRMVEDCHKGLIDLIIVKSVSRFGRNTIDSLKTVRELLAINVVVFFELQNIYTNDPTAELSLSIACSVAQEESRNLSTACKWGIQKRYQNPDDTVARLRKVLGYDRVDRHLVINPVEAEIIKRIYREFLDGKSTLAIARGLEADGISTGYGKTKWYESSVKKILKNEKYIGDMHLGKSYTVDYLTKHRVDNIKNEVADQYYKVGTHEAIIDKDTFDRVQAEIKVRSGQRGYGAKGRSSYTSAYPFSNKIYCYTCGSKFRRHYVRKTENTRYQWVCINKKLNGKDACSSKAICESDIEDAFVRALNAVIGGKVETVGMLTKSVIQTIGDNALRTGIAELDAKIDEKQAELLKIVKDSGNDNDAVFIRLFSEVDALRRDRMSLEDALAEQIMTGGREKDIKEFIDDNIALEKFDGDIFKKFVDKIMVISATEVEFVFYAGQRVRQVLQ